MSYPTAFPANSSNLPRAVIITLGTENGAVIVRLHTSGEHLHIFSTFVNRNGMDVQMLWTTIEPPTRDTDFELVNHAVTIPEGNHNPVTRYRQQRQHIRVDTRQAEAEEPEEPPAPPYEPAPPPAQPEEYHTPQVQTPVDDEPQYELALLDIAGNPADADNEDDNDSDSTTSTSSSNTRFDLD